MEIKELVEKFLPGFEPRFKAFKDRQDKLYELYEERYKIEDDFYSESFHEAMQIFVDSLCEKQRDICATIYLDQTDEYDYEPLVYEQIFDAEQPNIDEL